MRQQFEAGELVYCQTEEGTWVGEIVAVGKSSLTVKWFGDDSNYKVPTWQVAPFAKYLDEQRRSRKLKFVYAQFFGGPPLERMPRRRLDKLRDVLRRHGVQFDDVTRADDTFRMWMNRAHLTKRERAELATTPLLSEDVTEWLPKWLVPDQLPPSSRDPLGLQADAGRLADQLLPGLTVFTRRVGYFFFLAWALREINSRDDLTYSRRREAVNSLERALVMCETLHHGQEGLSECYHLGQRSKTRLLAQAGTLASIPERILKNQNNTGCYSLYRTSMVSCGIWEENIEAGAAGQLPFQLTERGRRLASAFGHRPGSDGMLQWALNGARQHKVQTLQEWGRSFCFCRFQNAHSEKKWFLDGFLFAQNDRSDTVRDADIRLRTLQTLASEGLLTSWLQPPVESPVSSESAGAETAESEDVPEGTENTSCLLYFYRHRKAKDAGPFVGAAIHELLGLALNAIFAELMDFVREHGRVPLRTWIGSLEKESHDRRLWKLSPGKAVAGKRVSEADLTRKLFRRERMVEHGLLLAFKVLARADNREILQQQLGNTTVRHLWDDALLSYSDKTVEDVLVQLVCQLIGHHRQVSQNKGKERWLDLEGEDVLDVSVPGDPTTLRFHSYRLPELRSLVRDLQLKEADLANTQR